MLVLPIINRGRILNVKIELADAKKIKENINIDGIKESDIIITGPTGTNLKDSSYNNKNVSPEEITEFIRNNNKMSKTGFMVTTKTRSDSNTYDIYGIPNPPKKVSNGLDRLYGSMILDLKNEIPRTPSKVRYVDFEKMNIFDTITEEKLEKLELIAQNLNSNYQNELNNNNLNDLIETLEFLKLFNCEVIESSSIKLDKYIDVMNFFYTINNKDSKNINNYYKTAFLNKRNYSNLSKLYNIVYKDSLNWIQSKNKIKVKMQDKRKAA